MSNENPMPDGDDGLEPPGDEILAGEFVLGVLDAAQRRAVQARIETDRAFVGQVDQWEQRLGPLASGAAPADVPPHLWRAIRVRLGWDAEPVRRSLWHSVGLWRTATALAAAIAVAAILIGRMPWNAPPQQNPTVPSGSAPVATLARDNGTPAWLASIDAAHGTLYLVPVPGPRDVQGRTPELWLIAPGQPPRALGLLSSDQSRAVVVPPDLRSVLRTGSTLAISLEPPGGAPRGAPTGPIIAKGMI